ncbi:MAG: flagellar hook protein FlgE [Vicinamibacterales bacterium]
MGFAASLSGLYANQQKLNVIGNNLANLNTIGFKASTVQFMDLVSQSVGGTSINPMQIGLGVTTGSISPNFRQGGVETTGIATNVAIQGGGFFVIGGNQGQSYTRAGDFSFDSQGVLVTPDGQPVQGYTQLDPLTGNVIVTGQPGDIVIQPGILRAPVATGQFSTTTNLDAGAAVGDTFTAAVQIYDSLGEQHVVTISYTKTGAGAWNYSMSVPGEDVTGGTPGTPTVINNGTLTFDGQGRLNQVNGGAAADVVVNGPAWANGAAVANFTWDLVDANGTASLTGFGSPSSTSSISQNGSPSGPVTALGIDSEGQILATFGTGAAIVIGQLALANFNNPQGLTKIGSNRFSESDSSGQANIGVAGTGGRGTLTGGAVEQSNVDIAQEFTQMILAQRGYQANSKSITVTDELLLETLNLKR